MKCLRYWDQGARLSISNGDHEATTSPTFNSAQYPNSIGAFCRPVKESDVLWGLPVKESDVVWVPANKETVGASDRLVKESVIAD